jgi:hypothetical protein
MKVLPCALTWSRSNRWFVPHRLIPCTAEQGLLHGNSGHYYSQFRLRSCESRVPFQRCYSVLCKVSFL